MRSMAQNAGCFPDQVGAYAPREPAIYRYAVRTDRGGSKAIEKLARAAGVSPDALVQSHFEQLLLASKPAAAEEAAPARHRPVAPALTVLGVTPLATRVLVEMAKIRDAAGIIRASSDDRARVIGSSANAVSVARSALIARGHLVLVQRGGWRSPSVYRIPLATLALIEGAKTGPAGAGE